MRDPSQSEISEAFGIAERYKRGDPDAIVAFQRIQGLCAEGDEDATRHYKAMQIATGTTDSIGPRLGVGFDLGGLMKSVLPLVGPLLPMPLSTVAGVANMAMQGHPAAQAHVAEVHALANDPSHPDHPAALQARNDLQTVNAIHTAIEKAVTPIAKQLEAAHAEIDRLKRGGSHRVESAFRSTGSYGASMQHFRPDHTKH